MRVPNFTDGCLLTQVYGRVRSDFYQVRQMEGGILHQDLKYPHQQIHIHFQIKMDLIFFFLLFQEKNLFLSMHGC